MPHAVQRSKHPLVDRVRNALGEAACRDCTLAVAVSGGPDSLALLHLLDTLRTPLGLRLHVVHVNHHLRAGAGGDARFVRAQAETLDLPCTVVDAEVRRDGARGRRSPEEAARDTRYAALAHAAVEIGAKAVVLGHTADDQAETVLLHLVRGSGLTGLRGMEPVSRRAIPGGLSVILVRPLLTARRSETAEYCRTHGLAPLLDETNLDTSVPRNQLRLEVLPSLARINPEVVGALNRLARSAQRDTEYLQQQALDHWPRLAEETPHALRLERRTVLGLEPALQRYLLRAAYASVSESVAGLEEVHLEQALALAAGPSGKALSLPGGVTMTVEYHHIVFQGDAGLPDPSLQLVGEHPLRIPGETAIPGWHVEAQLGLPTAEEDTDPYEALLAAESLGGLATVRRPRPGDRFQPLGMKGHSKKLQDFFVDTHVPRLERPRTPLVVTPRGVAWVVGWRIADWAKVTADSERAVRLRFERDPAGTCHE